VNAQDDADVSSTVTIKLKDGRTFSQHATDFKGAPSRPLNRDELHEKFMLLTQKQDEAAMQRLFDRIQGLENEPTLDWLSV
jgi:2-methylcitrate dehydratase PrpD